MLEGIIIGALACGVVLTTAYAHLARRERAEWRQRLERERRLTQLARMGVRSPRSVMLLQAMRDARESAQKWTHRQGCGCHWCKEMAA